MCSACRTQDSLPADPDTSATSQTSILPPWARYSLPLHVDIDVDVELDALIEDPDDRPYIWDL